MPLDLKAILADLVDKYERGVTDAQLGVRTVAEIAERAITAESTVALALTFAIADMNYLSGNGTLDARNTAMHALLVAVYQSPGFAAHIRGKEQG